MRYKKIRNNGIFLKRKDFDGITPTTLFKVTNVNNRRWFVRKASHNNKTPYIRIPPTEKMFFKVDDLVEINIYDYCGVLKDGDYNTE